MERRSFLKNSAVAATALATGLGQLKAGPAPDSSVTAEKTERIGRPVRVVSIGFHPGHSLDEIAAWVDQAGAGGTDLVVLPETCRGQDGKNQESLSGPTITALSRVARKHRTYIVCPIDRRTATTRHNSAVLWIAGEKWPVFTIRSIRSGTQSAFSILQFIPARRFASSRLILAASALPSALM